MGDLIELIFSNFLILAAIIGGIISWFSGMTKESENKQRPDRKTSPVPPSYPSGPNPDLEEKAKAGDERLTDYYKTKQKKLAEVKEGRKQSVDQPRLSDSEGETYTQPSFLQKEQRISRSQLNQEGPLIENTRKWDKKRLAEGILMAEVLGPPRAHKPHSSHPRKR
ncbi:hypothetical protein SAMN05192559_102218 [Halobacillus karajensis]|uniref:Uncharacterized protein n=1 Tax=Halobacillus karajensis TaxID=195088 RepID=A0A024P6V7_9BACI|nr:hypothetical protein [Halobacillus karajensis]CDQ18041.1 hypothetical protein BN982_00287 [Halobacillus karajensis]CDQ24391.1 hypothetical protein BN983_02671 [Halobacillus karajensis]CDQ29361.1 hypothetical protein BN981_03736 [Halobacillus karajensis]SEH60432.1 hypothetical protein SAMN05192559_102218 [Halobacillus karajensis]